MGNIDSRCRYDFGYLVVQTDQQLYNPGSQVTGRISIRCTNHCEPKQIILYVRGVEKVSFMDNETRTHEVDGRRETRTVVVKRRHKKEIFKQEVPAFVFTAPLLQPGDYSIPFSFVMPAGLPSSFQYIDQHIWQKPKGKVKYTIKARMIDSHTKELMRHKQVLILREQGEAFQQNIVHTDENNISTWCCMSQGVSRVTTTFEKNVFEPHETCKAIVSIDNSQCNLQIQNVRLCLEQELVLTTGGHTFRHTYTLADQTQGGV